MWFWPCDFFQKFSRHSPWIKLNIGVFKQLVLVDLGSEIHEMRIFRVKKIWNGISVQISTNAFIHICHFSPFFAKNWNVFLFIWISKYIWAILRFSSIDLLKVLRFSFVYNNCLLNLLFYSITILYFLTDFIYDFFFRLLSFISVFTKSLPYFISKHLGIWWWKTWFLLFMRSLSFLLPFHY